VKKRQDGHYEMPLPLKSDRALETDFLIQVLRANRILW